MRRVTKSIFDAIGVCLPDRRVTTAEILEGCRNPVRLPLERLTGIRERRLAGETQFSIDLAEEACRRCLEGAPVDPRDYDIVVCTNISRRDGANQFSYEPAASVTLKKRLGLERALAIDLTNACAGMWTGVYLVDALVRTGEIRHGLVVSGEYISYLIDTAQREIVDFMDPQIASLTLGDAGVAVSLGLSPSPDVGLHDLDLYTLGKYSPYCVAKPTDKEHGGAVMYTDAIKVTESVVPHAARHAKQVVDRNGWALDRIDHIIPHQTSRLTMQEAQKEIQRLYSYDFGERFLNNLAERGNTSSNSHFLAIYDAIHGGKIRAGDDLVFCISGSGQTTGTALYTCDDLPRRVRGELHGRAMNGVAPAASTLPAQLAFEGIATAKPADGEDADTLTLLESAATKCLEECGAATDDVDLLLSVGTYRTDFVMEPAIAALAAGRLKMNDDRAPDDEHKTLAFDLMNGPVGFLKACYLASELARAGALERAMILAGEVENNRRVQPDQLLGVEEMASAAVLSESADGEAGFLAFAFRDFLDAHDLERVDGGWNSEGKAFVQIERQPELWKRCLECVAEAAAEFLTGEGVAADEVSLLVPPQVSTGFVSACADRLNLPAARTVTVPGLTNNLATSSVPAGLLAARQSGAARPGDLALVLSVGAGVQTGCALYRF